MEQLESSYLVAISKGWKLDFSFSNNDSFLINNEAEDELKNLFDSIDLEYNNPIDEIFQKLNNIMSEIKSLSTHWEDHLRWKTELNFEFEKTLLQLKEAYAQQ